MPSMEGLKIKLLNIISKILKKQRHKKIVCKDFTIISNNCWGGMVYESLNLPKMSPTVGLFFMADEYINFLKSFPAILNEEIEFIDPIQSKYYEKLKSDKRFGSYPIGVIGGVEVEFLHYSSKEEVLEKWRRRVNRINFQNLIIKINDQNGASVKHFEEFNKLPFENKIIFSSKKYQIKNLVYIKSSCGEHVMTSEEPIVFKRNGFDVIEFINKTMK